MLRLIPFNLSAPLLILQLLVPLAVLANDPDVVSEGIHPLLEKPFQGDLDVMRKRGAIRVLVGYNRTNFFFNGVDRAGFEYELAEKFKAFLNKGRSRRELQTDFIYIPVPFEQLMPALNSGFGDMIAAGMTITPTRSLQVNFSRPYISGVKEVLVSRQTEQQFDHVYGLSGQQVHVLRGSSYFQHLVTINAQLARRGEPAIEIVEVDRNIQTEDLLELVAAGAIAHTVADHHIAQLWSQVLPEMHINENVVLNEGGKIAWAVRKDSPELLKQVNLFLGKNSKGSLLGNILFKRYYEKTEWIRNPLKEGKLGKQSEMVALFRKYGGEYKLDWLMLAAQGFQESRLNQSKRSPAGAIGVMQILKSTAADKNVAISSIDKLENNIHAGAKYMAFLRSRYFSNEMISQEDQVYFAMAAYNAGPAKVARMRKRAMEMGLDPSRWFGHVELAALRIVGQETVRYVRNILKYYTAYLHTIQTTERREIVRADLCDQADAGGREECKNRPPVVRRMIKE
ncbi:MAG: transporter substrate-binding domain-containing protein [Gammaproteobacteria bacterium]|nr:transporter substrate-binding domain-containing protein [Gammaproteobacteria bacterium]